MILKWLAVGLMALLTIGTGVAVAFEAGRQSVNKQNPTNQLNNNKMGQVQVSGPSGTESKKCIVTLFNNQYDVTKLATSHGGPRGLSTEGGFFKCGRDMSQEYASKHGNNLNRMNAYLIRGNGNTVAVSGPPTKPNAEEDEWEEDD